MKAALFHCKNKLPQLALALALSAMITACASQDTNTEAGAQAAASETAAPATANTLAENEAPLICRREQVTGTNFRERVCLTSEGWKALQRSERRTATEYSRQTSEAAGQAAAQQSNVPAGNGL